MAADPRQARALLAEVEALNASCAALAALPDGLASATRAKVGALRRELANAQMDLIPLGRLKETAKGLRPVTPQWQRC